MLAINLDTRRKCLKENDQRHTPFTTDKTAIRNEYNDNCSYMRQTGTFGSVIIRIRCDGRREKWRRIMKKNRDKTEKDTQ